MLGPDFGSKPGSGFFGPGYLTKVRCSARGYCIYGHSDRFHRGSVRHIGLTMASDDRQKKSTLPKLRVSALEADLAYFAARLAIIGRPMTMHQRAQMKAYRALEQTLGNILKRLRRSEKRKGG